MRVGPGGGSQPLFDETLNAYIDPVSFDESWVLRFPAGGWRLSFYTSHQCTSSTDGFNESSADATLHITTVSDGDVDGNEEVNTQDLLRVISAWENCGGCQEDLDGDGEVGVSDLLIVVKYWG